jgi:amino acid transporter
VPPSPPTSIRDSAAQHGVGVGAVVASQSSEIAPATVIYGVVTTAVAVTGLLGVPIAMLAVAAVLLLFCVGYLAMARHIPNAGAFGAYVARGIAKPAGVGSALLALAGYLAFNQSAFGGFGATVPLLAQDWFGVDVPWWVFAFGAVALVGFLGTRRLDLVGKVLAVLVIAETAAVVVTTIATVIQPGFHFSATAMNPSQLWGGDGAKLFVIAMTGYVGFEAAPVYIREARDPKRTVPRATYLTLIAVAVLYWLTSWVQISAAGANVAERAAAEGPGMFSSLATAGGVGTWLVDTNNLLFSTSLFAAAVAFHAVGSRYLATLGQEGVLPKSLGDIIDEAPRRASLAISALSVVVVGCYAVTGLDPLVKLFFWGGTVGATAVLLLSALTCVAVIGFFARDPRGESVWHRLVAPLLAGVILLFAGYLALTNLDTLFGPGSETIATATPVAFLLIMIVGVLWGLFLRARRPEVYAGIGLGMEAAGGNATFDAVFDAPITTTTGARR